MDLHRLFRAVAYLVVRRLRRVSIGTCLSMQILLMPVVVWAQQNPVPNGPNGGGNPPSDAKSLHSPHELTGDSGSSPNTAPPVGTSPANTENSLEVPRFTDFQSFLEPFIYDPKNRKDPFKPYVEVEPIDNGELQGPLLPLQRFDTSEIKLVGIIWDVKAPKAMFLDPTNTVHIIGKNERIGRNNGYIAMIREGEVVVVEATRKDDEVVYTTTVMKISR